MSVNFDKTHINIFVEVPAYKIKSGGSWVDKTAIPKTQLALVNKISATDIQQHTKYHGLAEGEYNAGFVRGIPDYTFNLSLPETSESARFMRAIFQSKVEFTTYLEDSEPIIEQFQLLEERFYRCKVVNYTHTYEIEGIPTITFNCTALSYDFSSKDITTEDVVRILDETFTENDAGQTVNVAFGQGLAEKDETFRSKLISDVW